MNKERCDLTKIKMLLTHKCVIEWGVESRFPDFQCKIFFSPYDTRLSNRMLDPVGTKDDSI